MKCHKRAVQEECEDLIPQVPELWSQRVNYGSSDVLYQEQDCIGLENRRPLTNVVQYQIVSP